MGPKETKKIRQLFAYRIINQKYPDMKTPDQIQQHHVDEVKLIYKSTTPPSQRVKVNGSQDAFRAFLVSWEDSTLEHREQFKVMLLNRSNKVLGVITISVGGISGTAIDIRLIFQSGILANASSIIVCHNHPSGNLKPSEADVKITTKIRDAGKGFDRGFC